MKELFNTLFFEPLYNTLIALIGVVPGGDVGIAVILLTIIVKLVLFPLSKSAVKSQLEMRELQKPMEDLKEKYKDDREKLGLETLELYKKHGINPFAGLFLVLIQLPVILALYWVILNSGLPTINTDILYSFIKIPGTITMEFISFFHISEPHSVVLALLAAISQHFQARFSFPKQPPKPKTDKPSFQDDMMRGMSIQVTWVLPIFVFFVSYSLAAVVSLYWFVSNLFAIGQELYIRDTIKKPAEEKNKLKEA
jgi:YidC/Oxa1 family membrane protein insertase